jgi:hypothetical protein
LSRDGVKHLIERLSGHQPLVSQAYYGGEVIKDEDNARGIELLQQYKVLIPRGEAAFSLHTTLRRFLDASLNIERLYGIGADLGAGFERIEQLAEALFGTVHEGQAEDRERLEDEIRQSIYEVSDNLGSELAHLRNLVENRFAAVRSLAEKKRQNAYYIGRTEKLVLAIEIFTLSDLGERIQSQAAFANIAVMFRTQLLERLPSFRRNLSDILEILRHYLFEFREIEERTRRVRSLWHYLERNPVYEIQAWDESAHPQPWLLKVQGTSVRGHPSVRDPEYSETLEGMASKIAPPTIRLPVERPRGNLLEDEPVPIIPLQIKAFQRALEQLASRCKAAQSRQSVRDWHRDHPADLGEMPLSVWLQYVLEALNPSKQQVLGIEVIVMERTHPVFDGNVTVEDAIVVPA